MIDISTMDSNGCGACEVHELERFGLISVSGPERVHFLQGQLTNDVCALKPGQLMTAGWCMPQGRLICTPRLLIEDERILMIVPKDQLQAIVKRLKMYVLRSKVEIAALDNKRVYAVLSDKPGLDLSDVETVFPLPSANTDMCRELGIPSCRSIFVSIPREGVTADSSHFLAASIAAGDPWVFADTAASFIPHGVNLELAGGVSFSKGCYTGQEVVSRVEHIGKPSRRSAVGLMDEALDIAPKADVTDAEGNLCGTVVYHSTVGGKTAVMVELAVAFIHAQQRQACISGKTLRLFDLPYGYVREK